MAMRFDDVLRCRRGAPGARAMLVRNTKPLLATCSACACSLRATCLVGLRAALSDRSVNLGRCVTSTHRLTMCGMHLTISKACIDAQLCLQRAKRCTGCGRRDRATGGFAQRCPAMEGGLVHTKCSGRRALACKRFRGACGRRPAFAVPTQSWRGKTRSCAGTAACKYVRPDGLTGALPAQNMWRSPCARWPATPLSPTSP